MRRITASYIQANSRTLRIKAKDTPEGVFLRGVKLADPLPDVDPRGIVKWLTHGMVDAIAGERTACYVETLWLKQCVECELFYIGPKMSKTCCAMCSAQRHTRQVASNNTKRVTGKNRDCGFCNKPMGRVRANRLYCSSKCRQAAFRLNS